MDTPKSIAIWEGVEDIQIHGYLQNGLKRLPKAQATSVARKFIQTWCESCAKENDCTILFDFICDRPVEEWKVQGCFPFCDQYEPLGKEQSPNYSRGKNEG